MIRSRKPTKAKVRKKGVSFLGQELRTQRWRHKEECLDTPIGDLPEYPEYQGRLVLHGLGAANAADRVPALARVLALMAEDWQASRSLLVVAARSPSLFHGGARLERKWRHKRKVRRLWNHVPEIVEPFVCGMSDAERRPGCGPSEDVVTFTQSTPKIVEGAATQEEICPDGQSCSNLGYDAGVVAAPPGLPPDALRLAHQGVR